MDAQTRHDAMRSRQPGEALSHTQSNEVVFPFRELSLLYFTLDLTGAIRAINALGVERLGHPIDMLLQIPIFRLFAPEERSKLQQVIAALAQDQNQATSDRFHLIGQDNTLIAVNVAAQILQSTEGPLLLLTCQEISELDQQIALLQAREKRYRRIISISNEGIWEIDADSNTSFVNARIAEMLGYSTEEMLGMSLFAFMDQEGQAIATEKLNRWRQGIAEQHDFKFRRKDGSKLWAIISTNPIFDEQGHYAGALAMVMDITDRKRAELALQQSEARLRALIENLPFSCWFCDKDGRHILQNAADIQRWGNMIGRTKDEVDLPSEIRERWKNNDRRAYSGEVVRSEAQYPVNNELRTFFYILAPVFGDGTTPDDVHGIVGVSIDINDRKQAELALQQSEARLRSLIENLPFACWVCDANNRYVLQNRFDIQQWGNLVGRTNEEANLSPEVLRHWQNNHRRALAGEIVWDEQQRLVDGETRTVLAILAPVLSDGRIDGIVGVNIDITDRKRAELALQQSEARLRSLIENLPFACWFCDSNNQYFLQNPIDMQYWGDLTGHSLTELNLPTALLEQWQHFHDRTLAGEVIWTEIQYPIEGKTRTFFEILAPVRNGKTIDGLVGVSIDITDRKQAELALQQSEARLRSLVENLPFGCWVCDVNGRYILQNSVDIQHWGDLTGRSPGDLTFDLPPALLERWRRFHDRALAGEAIWTEAQHLIEGKTHTFFKILAPVRNGETIDGLVGVSIDISDRKRTEEALQESEARIQRLISNLSGMIYRFFPDSGEMGTFTYVSSGSRELCNLEPEAILQDASLFWDKIHPDDFPSLQASVASAVEHCLPWQWEGRMLISSGQIRWIQGSSIPESTDYGTVWDGWIIDISDRKRAEVELQQAKEAAEAANRAKSMFLSQMSHELRTPLTAILGFAELISSDPDLTQDSRSHTEIISRSGTHLLSLINSVLEMSKIEAGEITLNQKEVDLFALLESVEELLRLKATSKGLKLIFERAETVPQYIQTDAGKLRQILINLLNNAIKFTDSGSVSLRVSLSRQRSASDTQSPNFQSADRLCFEVEDTGPGIAPEEAEQVFVPFSQTQTGRSTQGGTGLGLAISQQFVQLMGGAIALRSQPQQGAVFVVEIPLQLSETARLQQKAVVQRQAIGIVPDATIYRILVVDDQPEARQILLAILAPLGFEVLEATDGQAAIAIWQQWRPQLIWMDLRMPGIDGYAATRQIRAAEQRLTPSPGQRTVIIALSANAFAADQDAALAAGCDDFIAKPFRKRMLLEKIAEHLGVQYVYAESLASDAPARDYSLTASSLSVMSTGWLTQLQAAAARLSYDQCIRLVEQIPEEQVVLANALRELINSFQFDILLDLLRPIERL